MLHSLLHGRNRVLLDGRSRGGGAQTPEAVFGARLLYWNDPSDLTVTWQDSARTTPAAVGQVVGSRQNKGTLAFYMEQPTGGSRPILRQTGGYYYDESDTLDDGLLSSAALDLTAYNKLTLCIGIKKEGDSGAQSIQELSSAWNSNAGAFHTFIDAGSSYRYATGARGTTAFGATQIAGFASGFAATNQAVLFAEHDIAGDLTTLSADATAATDATGDKGAGNFGNYTLYEMRRGGASLPLVGSLYQRFIIAGLLTADEKAWLKTYVGAKMGKVL